MHNSFCPKYGTAAVIGCWLMGLFLGIMAAVKADASVVSLMRLCACRRVSIVPLFFGCALPLWITAWSVMIQRFEILFLSVFCRCFFLGLFLWLEVRAFGSAVWLSVPLSRFSDVLSMLPFGWLVFRSLRSGGKWDFWICLVITALLVIVDFFAVSPFAATL